LDIVIKEIDSLGRIYIPSEWRKNWRKVLLIRMPDGSIVIKPIRKKLRLTDLIDSIVVDLNPEEFADTHKLRGKLREEKIH